MYTAVISSSGSESSWARQKLVHTKNPNKRTTTNKRSHLQLRQLLPICWKFKAKSKIPKNEKRKNDKKKEGFQQSSGSHEKKNPSAESGNKPWLRTEKAKMPIKPQQDMSCTGNGSVKAVKHFIIIIIINEKRME